MQSIYRPQDLVLASVGLPDKLRPSTVPHGRLVPLSLPEQPIISLVVPTRNEADNVEELVSRVARVSAKLPIQMIVVDDSSDHTPQLVEQIGDDLRHPIVLIHRPPDQRRDGLGGAVVLGLRAARTPWVGVMDADLQHPPELIPSLLHEAVRSGADVVVASRYRRRGDDRGFSTARAAVSRGAGAITRLCFPWRLRHVTDPMSGFFLVRRDAVDPVHLRPSGFKILLEILVRTPRLRIAEIPFRFEYRHAGRSKATFHEGLRFLRFLVGLRLAGDERRIARFAVVGASGVGVQQALLAFATEITGFHYLVSAVIAIAASVAWNFTLTELWVFYDRRRRGTARRGVLFAVMSVGALGISVPLIFVLTSIVGLHYLLSSLCSIAALVTLRFCVADRFIWRRSAPEGSPGQSNHVTAAAVSAAPRVAS